MPKETYQKEELNRLTSDEKDTLILGMQDEILSLKKNYEQLMEQFRVFEQQRFGRHTEKLDQIAGQMCLFDETEVLANPSIPEPPAEEILPAKTKRKKQPGSRAENLKDLEHEAIPPHDVSREELDRHQDEFLRGDRPADPIENSIATPSLIGAVINGKYALGLPYERIAAQLQADGIQISKQNLANWVIRVYEDYFRPFCGRLKKELFTYHVNQSDETPVQVLHYAGEKDNPAVRRAKSYMWVHRSGEFYTDRPVILYEYNKSRGADVPIAYYKGYTGIIESDALQQYHILENRSPGITSANCWAHGRRSFADAIKAIGKTNEEAIKQSAAYKALTYIAAIYHIEGTLKELTPQERHQQRQEHVKPLVDAFFAWAKQEAETDATLPKGKTRSGLNYCIHQEKYLRVFLDDGEVPIDNSAAERAIRPFTVGRKNWLFFNTERGAEAGAGIYSIVETAKANHLNPFWYFTHLLTVLPELRRKYGTIDAAPGRKNFRITAIPSAAEKRRCFCGRRRILRLPIYSGLAAVLGTLSASACKYKVMRSMKLRCLTSLMSLSFVFP